jgi:restriction endonuclease S subunit
MQVISKNQFLIKRSELTTEKLFVEFYLPEYQNVLTRLRQSPYPLESLRQLCTRMFDGPFGSNRKVDMYQDEGIPYIRVKDVLPGEIAKADLTFISQDKHQELNRSRVVPGNVLLTIAGRVGTAAVFPADLAEGNITGHIAGIELPERTNPEYFALFLNSRFGQFQLARLAHRTTRPELNLKEVGQVLVTLPPRSIQDRIAQIMQDAYAARRSKLAEAQTLLINIDQYVFKNLGISPESVPEETRFVKNASEIRNGRFDVEFNMGFHKFDPYMNQVQPLQKVVEFLVETKNPTLTPEQEFYYIDIATVDPLSGEITEPPKILGQDAPSRARQVIHAEDIIMSTVRPTRGATAIVPKNMDGYICSTGFVVVRAQRDILPEYLHIALRLSTTREQLGRRSSGSSYPAVLTKDIKEVLIPVPDKGAQKTVVDAVNERRTKASLLKVEAENIITKAKQQVERMILGEDVDP